MNTALLEMIVDEEFVPEEIAEMGSLNHSYFQAKLTGLLLDFEEYIVFTELTLDVRNAPWDTLQVRSQNSLKPDICLYRSRILDLSADILQMTEMPLLAVEILSPMQGMQIILDKFKIYFALGVQSCWLVFPAIKSIAVYESADHFTMFSAGTLTDDIMNIHLLLTTLFS